MFNIKLLETLSKKYPALARLLEGVIGLAFIEAVYFLLTTIIDGVEFSWQGLLTAAALPIYLAVSKKRRDLLK